MTLNSYVVPAFVIVVFAYGKYKQIDLFEAFIKGASENIKTAFDILPALIILMTIITMLNASGVVSAFSQFLSPALSKIGFPTECIPLAILRPISGSGALSVYETILQDNHPDSFVGRVASVMMGSTETTFYTVAIYYGAVKIKNIRHTLVCALAADITGFIVACTAVRLML